MKVDIPITRVAKIQKRSLLLRIVGISLVFIAFILAVLFLVWINEIPGSSDDASFLKMHGSKYLLLLIPAIMGLIGLRIVLRNEER